MAGLVIRSTVSGGADHDLLSEEVEYIQLGPTPCDVCVMNAGLEHPEPPPVPGHPKDWYGHCQCTLVHTTIRELA